MPGPERRPLERSGDSDVDSAWAPPAPAPIEQVVGSVRTVATIEVAGYSDLREVARGGDSIVFHARQDSPERDVAIKVVDVGDDDRARFERELAITVRLGRAHPHIVTVLATTTASDGRPCLVMDFHDLGSLHDRLRAHGPLPAAEVVAAGTAVADALAYAHGQGVLHRDVKPQNVLVLPTSYVLTDFGIARMADAGRTSTLERFSYRHASPQVLDGHDPVIADDIWSLGSTLFTLLDGRAPFASDEPDEDTALAYLRRVRLGERRPLLRDDVPGALREVVEACLDPVPENRPAAAADVLAALRAVPTETRSWVPSTPAEKPPEPVRTPAPDHAGGTAPPDAHPATPDPARPAPSALAHLVPATPAAAPPDAAPSSDDGVPTSRGLPDDGAGGVDEPDPDEQADDGVPAWRRLVAFLGGAAVVGAAIGVGSAVLNRTQADDPPSGPTVVSTGTIPTRTDPVPEQTDLVQAETGNPDLAASAVVAVDRGTSAEVTWSPPAFADTQLIVVMATAAGTDPVPGELLAAGRTSYTFEGVDPNADDVCFYVIGIGIVDGDLDRGSSGADCLAR